MICQDVGCSVLESFCAHRFCPVDARCGIPLDCTEEKQIKSLVQATEEYIEANSARIQRVCDMLMQGCDEPLVCSPVGGYSAHAQVQPAQYTVCTPYLLQRKRASRCLRVFLCRGVQCLMPQVKHAGDLRRMVNA